LPLPLIQAANQRVRRPNMRLPISGASVTLWSSRFTSIVNWNTGSLCHQNHRWSDSLLTQNEHATFNNPHLPNRHFCAAGLLDLDLLPCCGSLLCLKLASASQRVLLGEAVRSGRPPPRALRQPAAPRRGGRTLSGCSRPLCA
jgi:hypothetical protein